MGNEQLNDNDVYRCHTCNEPIESNRQGESPYCLQCEHTSNDKDKKKQILIISSGIASILLIIGFIFNAYVFNERSLYLRNIKNNEYVFLKLVNIFEKTEITEISDTDIMSGFSNFNEETRIKFEKLISKNKKIEQFYISNNILLIDPESIMLDNINLISNNSEIFSLFLNSYKNTKKHVSPDIKFILSINNVSSAYLCNLIDRIGYLKIAYFEQIGQKNVSEKISIDIIEILTNEYNKCNNITELHNLLKYNQYLKLFPDIFELINKIFMIPYSEKEKENELSMLKNELKMAIANLYEKRSFPMPRENFINSIIINKKWLMDNVFTITISDGNSIMDVGVYDPELTKLDRGDTISMWIQNITLSGMKSTYLGSVESNVKKRLNEIQELGDQVEIIKNKITDSEAELFKYKNSNKTLSIDLVKMLKKYKINDKIVIDDK